MIPSLSFLRSRLSLAFFSLLAVAPFASHAQLPSGCKAAASQLPAADAALYMEDWFKANHLYKDRLKEDPTSLEALAGTIRVMLGQGQIADALKAALAMVSQHTDSVAAQTVLGETYVRRGELTPAAPPLAKALSIDPCYARAHSQEARLQALSGYHASAARQLSLAHALDPNDEQITIAWLFSLPPAERYPQLKEFVARAKYLNAADREDLKSSIIEAELRSNSHCTVSSPPQGTKIPFIVNPALSRDPSRPTFDAIINGKKHRLFLSTSDSDIVLPQSTAKSMGLAPLAKFTYSQLYAGGRTNFYLVSLPSVRIGDVEFKDCIATVFDENNGGAETKLEVFTNPSGADASLGALFLADFLVGVNTPKHELTLTPLSPPAPATDSAGLPLWSNVSQSDGKPVPSINGGAWGQYNRVVAPEMKGWTSLVQYRGNIWVPTHVGSGPAMLFEVELAHPFPRIATNAASAAARIETLAAGKTPPFHGYFLDFGGLLFPVDSWTSERYDEFSKKLKLETSGTIGGDALRQLSFTLDLRDNLIQFTRPK